MRFTSIVLLPLLLASVAVVHGAKWTYTGPEGEDHWVEQYPYCGGVFQSPVNIKSDLLRFNPTLGPIEVRNYNLLPSEQLTLVNDGHSAQLSLPSKMYISSLDYRYTAAQLHFHWGSARTPKGSEHTVNGRQYAAEMHIVHFNSDKYSSVSMAKDKSDGLAVLGVLIEIGEFNPAFEHFLKFISGIKYKDQQVQVPGFNIRSLMPARLDEYYRYDGSLTTPPCYPSVLWTVFRNSVTISHNQFLSLATTLHTSHAQDSLPVPLDNNYRKTQPIDSRIVLVSFKDGRQLNRIPTVTSPLRRKQVVQRLLVGDLADLADEQLYHLLPSGSEKFPVGRKRDVNSETVAKSKHPAPLKNSQTTHSVRKLGLAKKELCYNSIEEKVRNKLRQSQAEAQLVQTLSYNVFPQLNLKSYLDCKSDLAFPAIKHILNGRPLTDEVIELDHSIRKALIHRKASTANRKSIPVRKHGGLYHGNAHRKPITDAHPMLRPKEWED